MNKTIGTIIVGMIFIFIWVVLPILVGVIVEYISNIITIDFIIKAFLIITACSFIIISKLERR